jgi:hypothetical protein
VRNHIKWVSVTIAWHVPQVVDGGDSPQTGRVAINTPKKSLTTDERWSSSLGAGQGTNNSSV